MIEILKDFVKDNSELLLIGAFMFMAGFGLGAGIMDALCEWINHSEPRKREEDET